MVFQWHKFHGFSFFPLTSLRSGEKLALKEEPLINLHRNWHLSVTCIISGGTRISRSGGMDPLGGGVDLRHGCFSAKMYAKTKELGPVGGACTWHAP